MKSIVLLPVLLAFQVGVQPALAWTWPVDGPVLQPFSLSEDSYAAGDHRGVDVGTPSGAPVRAPAGGTVTFAGTVPGGGRTVTIGTADGYSVTLLHLGSITTAESAGVAEGEPVGTAGMSGEAEQGQPYVHFGIRLAADANGYVDPESLLPPRGVHVPEPAPTTETSTEKAKARPEKRGAGRTAGALGSAQTAPRAEAVPESGPKPRTERPPHPQEAMQPALSPAPASFARLHRNDLLWPVERPRQVGEVAARAGSISAGSISSSRPWFPGVWILCGLGLVAPAAVALLRRQLSDAGPADRPAAMLLELAASPAEDARTVRLREQDRLVLDRDLERILLAEAEPLPDLDGDHDAPELVQVSDDAGGHTPCRAGRSRRLSRAHRPPARPFSLGAQA